MRKPVPRRCKEHSDTGGQCEYNAGHTGHHSFRPQYAEHRGRRRNAMLIKMAAYTNHIDVWPTLRGLCRKYVLGYLNAEQLKSHLLVRLALEQCSNAQRKLNNTIRYYRRYRRNGLVQ